MSDASCTNLVAELFGRFVKLWNFWACEMQIEVSSSFLEFTSCEADRDVWMRKAVKEDETPYWEYILCYTDDVLVISDKQTDNLEQADRNFKLKDKSISPPKLYLGDTVTERELQNNNGDRVKAWGFSSS